GAARLVGKRVKARITAVTDGLAWAELLSPVEHVDEPLTAEAEAERPTRARRATAPRKAEATAELVAGADEADAEAEEDEGEEETQPAPDGETAVVAKKRTR